VKIGNRDRRGFTIVELLVVMAMIMLLAGAVTTSVSQANKRARVTEATADIQEITKAILEYENFGRANDDSPLAGHLMEEQATMEGSMGFILGREALKNGQKGNIPVLFNAKITRGAIRDPWGNPYYVTIRQSTLDPKESSFANNLKSYVTFPNFYRRPADEVLVP